MPELLKIAIGLMRIETGMTSKVVGTFQLSMRRKVEVLRRRILSLHRLAIR
jgi:hypothetical protein